MRRAILRGIKLSPITVALCLALSCRTSGQVHDRFEGWCDSLQNASSPDLVQFLNAVVPDEENARCVTWAIHRLGNEHYEPAITTLVRLLDFHRPQSPGGEIFHGLSKELFPAEVALELIGKKALPELLRAIEAASTSKTARENAVSVWMEAYKYERPKGVALLKQEETRPNNDPLKERLNWAVQKALTHCGPQEQAACREAAADRPSAR